MDNQLDQSKIEHIIQVCACANLRTVSGSLTQLYNRLLKPSGLKITQYYMLGNIFCFPNISISKLGELMLLDQTTVTRNLNILKESAYVTIMRDEYDSRTKIVSITETGIEKLNEAEPILSHVQNIVEESFGKKEYSDLVNKLEGLQKVIEEYDRKVQ
ncbi:MarR family transcriptional regulator [Sporosarcina newyorkensis 2681]|uniref:HTH-type transcriptional regulator SarZ n=1 Tax=Sporosarcina newyorkensis 2681 TaxID=1027292 RepID=F9DXA6_9BACL|nr:MarR family winged helix-turn-helix transcriptional regulator [Sporosarcina newyorkensis]EGQ21000.1 MarR family transcriptional regulator [Sporosarcina newyorkensis 2681]